VSAYLVRAARDIRDGIRTQRGRTALAFFAVAIGIMALTILIAVQEGLSARSRRLVQELGADVAALLPVEAEEKAGPAKLDARWAEFVAAAFPGSVVSAVQSFKAPAPDGTEPLIVVATDSRLAAVRRWPVLEGRFIDAGDERWAQRHAVVTRALRESEGWGPGDTIRLRGVAYTVVGVVDAGGAAGSGEPVRGSIATGERSVFVPRTAPLPLPEGTSARESGYDALYVRVPPEMETGEFARRAARLLAAPRMRPRTTWVTPDMLVAGIRRLQRTIAFSAGSVATLCLVLGGTTLMSLMLANVRDRVPEIGLRRAIGAMPSDIALLFVAEGCIVTAAASAAGIAAAALVVGLGAGQFPVPIVLKASTVLIPVLASVAMGAIFSWWPARSAARLSPAEALRND
jgi:putative ABC transport system permease protein